MIMFPGENFYLTTKVILLLRGDPPDQIVCFFLTLFKQFSNDMGNFIAFNVGAIVESVNKKKT